MGDGEVGYGAVFGGGGVASGGDIRSVVVWEKVQVGVEVV